MITKFKIFEENKPSLSWQFARWLEKFTRLNSEKFRVSQAFYQRGKGHSIALFHNERYSSPLFTIEPGPVRDKKQRPKQVGDDITSPTKMKINLDCHFHNYINDLSDREFVENLKDFMIDTFTRYSYFYKKNPTWSNFSNWTYNYDFYINISDIENIIKDLEDNFRFYIDAKRYNL